MKGRVAVGISGGVDSAVTAGLLIKDGFDVVGVTFKMFDSPTDECVVDASAVCDFLGIEHFIVDCSEIFKRYVIDDFAKSYMHGSTPNPCVWCNHKVKFYSLYKFAFESCVTSDVKFTGIATGHYSCILDGDLFVSCDSSKDQSYFLYRLIESRHILEKLILPLGNFRKMDVREIATAMKIPVSKKPDSQDVCFLKNANCMSRVQFIRNYAGITAKNGEIVDICGNVLGHHSGVENFTIGQRSGLNITVGGPYFVIDIKTFENRIIVGKKEDILTRSITIIDQIWIKKYPKDKVFQTKVRSCGDFVNAVVEDNNVKFATDVIRPARGQHCVFYEQDMVVGGGVIC